jgi:hypothetical protein
LDSKGGQNSLTWINSFAVVHPRSRRKAHIINEVQQFMPSSYLVEVVRAGFAVVWTGFAEVSARFAVVKTSFAAAKIGLGAVKTSFAAAQTGFTASARARKGLNTRRGWRRAALTKRLSQRWWRTS